MAEAVTENKGFHRNLSLISHGTLQSHMVTLAASQSGEVNIFSLTHWIKLGSFRKKEVMRNGINRCKALPHMILSLC